MSEWRRRSVAELARGGDRGVSAGPFGSALGRKDYVSEGVPVIRGAQLQDKHRFSFEDLVFVSDAKADRHPRNLAFPGDLVVTQRGTLGQVGLIPEQAPYDRFLLSQSQMKVSVDPALAHANFLYFVLRSPRVRQRLIDHAMTAGVPHINLATLREFEVSVPGIETQRRIAVILSAFDELIEVNERRIELLENLARSLYREWFVRFRFLGHQQVEFVESELGLVPEGWGVRRLGDLVEALVDGDWIETKDQGGNAYRLLQVSNIGIGSFRETGKLRYVSAETFSRLRCTEIRVGDILVSRMPEPVGRAWLVDYLSEPAITAVDVAIVRPASFAQGIYLNYWFNSPATLSHAEGVATGTTRKRISRSVLSRLDLLMPNRDHLSRFAERLTPLLSKQTALRRSLDVLAATRDLLLPRLVTGRLDMSEIDLGALLTPEVA